MWRIRPVGKHPWSDCRTWSGSTVHGKATVRPWPSVVLLIYIPCCWRILLSSGKYCSLPKWIACGWQIAPALHSIWSEAAHALLPVFPHFHPWASIIPCPSCFLSRHWPFRWCLSWPPWPVAPLGAIMDSVLIACWRTEAVLRRLIADSLGSTDVCLCDRCSNAARLENQPSMCLHTYRPTQFSSYTQCVTVRCMVLDRDVKLFCWCRALCLVVLTDTCPFSRLLVPFPTVWPTAWIFEKIFYLGELSWVWGRLL